jgi:hypothetical protein
MSEEKELKDTNKMEQKETKKTAKKVLLYSKNYYLKGIGPIGGKPVSADIDAILNRSLSLVGKKATDFHVDK